MTRGGVPLRLASAAVVVGALTACAKVPEQTSFMQGTRVTASAAEVRERAGELGMHAAAVIELAADSIRGVTDEPRVAGNALKLKTEIIPSIREASLRPDPLISLLDLMGLFYQLDDYFTTGAGAAEFGAQQDLAVTAVRHLIEDAHDLGRVITAGNDSSVARTDRLLRAWAAEHPITNSQYVRETPLGELEAIAADVGSIGAVAANLENEVRLLQQRVAFMSNYGAREIAWRTTLGMEDAVGQETIDSLRALIAHSAALAGEFPDLVASERAALVEAVMAERIAVLQELLTHRIAVLDALTSEREAAFADIRAERALLLEALAAERAAVLAGADSVVQHGVGSVRSLVNHALLILIPAGAAAIVLAGAAAFVVVRYARPPGRSELQ